MRKLFFLFDIAGNSIQFIYTPGHSDYWQTQGIAVMVTYPGTRLKPDFSGPILEGLDGLNGI